MLTLLAAVVVGSSVKPPSMFHRDIGPGWDAAAKTATVQDGDVSFQLYLPEGKLSDDLAIHFHGAAWFAIDEHRTRGLDGPLIVFNNGQGSSVYQTPFKDAERLPRWIGLVEAALQERQPGYRVGGVSITSFSAGYGAVREIVRDPRLWKRVRRILLLDSMYASHAADGSKTPDMSQIDVWVPFVRSAMAGERTFVFSYSQVPTDTYSNSADCARALAKAAGVPAQPVEPGTLAATLDDQFPLLERADAGRAHLWGYGGVDAQAHMTHARHLADVWQAVR